MSERVMSLVEEYLSYRRLAGFSLQSPEFVLRQFARYADEHGLSGPLRAAMMTAWASSSAKTTAGSAARKLDIVRGFARYVAAFEPATEIPLRGSLGPPYRRSPPYIYSPEEIRSLVCGARLLRPKGGLRASSYATAIGLLACTGLRISEALQLQCSDIDFKRELLVIRRSKFKKTRLVPTRASVMDAMRQHFAMRSDHGVPPNGPVFAIDGGRPIKAQAFRDTFGRLRKRLGIVEAKGRRRPRVHDLRHSFAVSCILRWYQENERLEPKLVARPAHVAIKVPGLETES